MKRVFFALLMVCLFVITLSAQQWVKVGSNSAMPNNDTTRVQVRLDDYGGTLGLDSIWYYIATTGEIDIDKVVNKVGFANSGADPRANFSDVNWTLNIDNPAGTSTVVRMDPVVGTNSKISGNVLNIYVITSAAGNDATDPNYLDVWLLLWY